jgi:hypothetical protein
LVLDGRLFACSATQSKKPVVPLLLQFSSNSKAIIGQLSHKPGSKYHNLVVQYTPKFISSMTVGFQMEDNRRNSG